MRHSFTSSKWRILCFLKKWAKLKGKYGKFLKNKNSFKNKSNKKNSLNQKVSSLSLKDMRLWRNIAENWSLKLKKWKNRTKLKAPTNKQLRWLKNLKAKWKDMKGSMSNFRTTLNNLRWTIKTSKDKSRGFLPVLTELLIKKLKQSLKTSKKLSEIWSTSSNNLAKTIK